MKRKKYQFNITKLGKSNGNIIQNSKTGLIIGAIN